MTKEEKIKIIETLCADGYTETTLEDISCVETIAKTTIGDYLYLVHFENGATVYITEGATGELGCNGEDFPVEWLENI